MRLPFPHSADRRSQSRQPVPVRRVAAVLLAAEVRCLEPDPEPVPVQDPDQRADRRVDRRGARQWRAKTALKAGRLAPVAVRFWSRSTSMCPRSRALIGVVHCPRLLTFFADSACGILSGELQLLIRACGWVTSSSSTEVGSYNQLQARPYFSDGADFYIHQIRLQRGRADAIFVEIRGNFRGLFRP